MHGMAPDRLTKDFILDNVRGEGAILKRASCGA